MIDNWTNLHAQNDNVFRKACCYGHMEVVRFLVEKGVNTSANDVLISVCVKGHLYVLEFLMEKD